MPKFIMTELVDRAKVITARLGAGSGAANNIDDKEVGKLVKLVAESRYDLCAVGNDIEGRISSVNTATQDAFSIGGVEGKVPGDRMTVTFDGLQGTPGTGTIAIGDIVVAGTPVAKGTALTAPAKVCKATNAATVVQKWRVISLGSAGTGAVGTTGLIERI